MLLNVEAVHASMHACKWGVGVVRGEQQGGETKDAEGRLDGIAWQTCHHGFSLLQWQLNLLCDVQ